MTKLANFEKYRTRYSHHQILANRMFRYYHRERGIDPKDNKVLHLGRGSIYPRNRLKRLNPDITKERGNKFSHLVHGKHNNVYQTFVIMI